MREAIQYQTLLTSEEIDYGECGWSEKSVNAKSKSLASKAAQCGTLLGRNTDITNWFYSDLLFTESFLLFPNPFISKRVNYLKLVCLYIIGNNY